MSHAPRLARIAALALGCLLVSLTVSTAAFAQDKPTGTTGSMSAEEKAMMEAMVKAGTPGPNHQMLASIAGDWTYKARMWMNPTAQPTESTGTVSYTTLFGGRYVEGQYMAT
jgi:hypothetical protein